MAAPDRWAADGRCSDRGLDCADHHRLWAHLLAPLPAGFSTTGAATALLVRACMLSVVLFSGFTDYPRLRRAQSAVSLAPDMHRDRVAHRHWTRDGKRHLGCADLPCARADANHRSVGCNPSQST